MVKLLGRKYLKIRDLFLQENSCSDFATEAAAGTTCPQRGDGLGSPGAQPEDHSSREER